MDLHKACLVNSCQRKDAGVLLRLKYAIHQHTGIGCAFNLAKIKSFLFVQPLPLFRTSGSRLYSLAYIESITNAYSQYFVNDIEHTKEINCIKSVNYHWFLSLELFIISFSMVFPWLSDNFCRKTSLLTYSFQ